MIELKEAKDMIGKKVFKVDGNSIYLRHSNEDFVFTFNKKKKDGVKSNTKNK